MEFLLLQLVALVRPLASMKFLDTVFVPLGGGLFVALVGAFLIRGAVQKTWRFSAVDGVIVAFAIWSLVVSSIYYESSRVGDVIKLLVPLLSYTIAKNIIADSQIYKRLLSWMFIGFSIPTIGSATLIALEHPAALDMINYWTSVSRWEGLYTHSHNLGHSMTLLLMALIVYFLLRGADDKGKFRRTMENGLMSVLGIAAIYALYMSQVRSAVLGLLAFVAIYTFLYKKRLFLMGTAAAVVVAAISVPYWFSAMFPEFEMRQRGIEVSNMDLGSGRPRFWLNDLTVYASLPLDQKLGGVGIGATRTGNMELYGHNDWLGMLTQTGLVGLLLYMVLQVLILRAILRMEKGKERFAFMAMFGAVNLMMLVSNSYAWRIQVSQLYYIMLAFIELPRMSSTTSAITTRGSNKSLDHRLILGTVRR